MLLQILKVLLWYSERQPTNRPMLLLSPSWQFQLRFTLQFVTETGSARGSNGILTNSTGDVFIKPCTQAEIDFYSPRSLRKMLLPSLFHASMLSAS